MEFKTSPEEIAAWLEQRSGGARVEVFDLPKNGLYIFRLLVADRAPYPELAVTEEALEDLSLDEISRDLRQDETIEWMRRQPTFRVTYTSTRSVEHSEQIHLVCEGERFRVVRGADLHVRFFDERDHELPGGGPRMLQVSIHRKNASEWCAEIRQLQAR